MMFKNFLTNKVSMNFEQYKANRKNQRQNRHRKSCIQQDGESFQQQTGLICKEKVIKCFICSISLLLAPHKAMLHLQHSFVRC